MKKLKAQDIISNSKFYSIPTIIIEDEKYKNMSLEAKVLYGVLRNHLNDALFKGWVDEENNIYFLYSLEYIADYIDVNEKEAEKMIEDLLAYKLLFLDEDKRMYLLEP